MSQMGSTGIDRSVCSVWITCALCTATFTLDVAQGARVPGQRSGEDDAVTRVMNDLDQLVAAPVRGLGDGPHGAATDTNHRVWEEEPRYFPGAERENHIESAPKDLQGTTGKSREFEEPHGVGKYRPHEQTDRVPNPDTSLTDTSFQNIVWMPTMNDFHPEQTVHVFGFRGEDLGIVLPTQDNYRDLKTGGINLGKYKLFLDNEGNVKAKYWGKRQWHWLSASLQTSVLKPLNVEATLTLHF